MDSKVRRQQTAHSLCKINQAQVGRLFQDAQSSGHEKPSILCFLVSRALVDDEDIGANLLSQQDSILLTGAKVCELPAQFPSGNPNLDPIWRPCRPIPDDVGAFRVLQFNNDRTRKFLTTLGLSAFSNSTMTARGMTIRRSGFRGFRFRQSDRKSTRLNSSHLVIS